jgi:division protein CdvB (Snf7/Vps24/ESCRT-III family)
MVKFRIIYQSKDALMIQKKKIEEATDRLKDQDTILYNACMDAVKKQNKKEVAKYASEIYELRKRIKFFYKAILAIDRLVIRIENFECDYYHEDPDGPVSALSKFKHIVQALITISQEISPFLPDVSIDLDNTYKVLIAVCNQECS